MTGTVFVNGRFLTQPISGQQRYSREIVRHIDAQLARRQLATPWVLLIPPGADTLPLRAIEQRVAPGLSGHAWEQLTFLRHARGGVALGLNGAGPLLHPRQLVVIHDAAVYRHPEHFGQSYRLLHQTIGRVLARTATLATVSDFSRAELASVLHVRPETIVVARNGSEHLRVDADIGIAARLGVADRPYFVMLGNLTRNKNLATAVKALNQMPREKARLVAIGSLNTDLFGHAGIPTSDALVLPGRLSDAEVVGLMRGARALLFPSIYEGFGIPPLEAMVNGCPVLASRIPALEEVCGAAAAYFDPLDAATLAALMMRAIDDDAWRSEMIAASVERPALFGWDAPAATLIDACHALLPARRQSRV